MTELNQIICGDNCETMAGFPDDCIDLVVTSPPYDNLRTYGGHSWDFSAVARQLWRIIKPGGVVVWVVADATVDGSETGTSFRQALEFMGCGFRLHDTMIYRKDSPQFPDANRYGQVWEYMFVCCNGRPATYNPITDRQNAHYGRKQTGTERRPDGTTVRKTCWGSPIKQVGQRFNVWDYRSTKGHVAKGHPAPFPEALARDHILSWSNEGDIVLDPFNGSGTTTKMARDMGRRYIGIEINPEYCEIAAQRLEQGVLFT